MPSIHHSGERIPEFGAAIQGGIAMTMRRPAEMDYVQSLCEMSADSNSPMHAMYGMLDSDVEQSRSPWLRRGFRKISQEERSYLSHHWREIADEKILFHDAVALGATLSFAREIWTHESEDLNAVLAIARPDSDGGELKIGRGKPALVLHRGSILASLASRSAISAVKFAVLLFPSSAVFPTQRAERIMEDFRAKALRGDGVEQLERIDAVQKGDLDDVGSVIIFVHGLLSIDVGLFDPLIRRLRTALGEDVVFLGFPHNTLTSIDTNGELLMREIERVAGMQGPRIALIGHSRGGLVARSAAARLFKRNASWQQKIAGCVTFGTPHEGCPLAEAPNDFLGTLIAIQAAQGGNGFFSLANALGYAHLEKSLDGIRDLRPADAKDSYLIKLRDLERASAPAKSERALEILAVGGKVKEYSGLLKSLARRMLAGHDSDLVVETRSSLSRFLPHREETDCDHFNYFNDYGMNSDHIQKVIDFLEQREIGSVQKRPRARIATQG
jgi:pimeloyl-ACP methyl ester carboxylesterase